MHKCTNAQMLKCTNAKHRLELVTVLQMLKQMLKCTTWHPNKFLFFYLSGIIALFLFVPGALQRRRRGMGRGQRRRQRPRATVDWQSMVFIPTHQTRLAPVQEGEETAQKGKGSAFWGFVSCRVFLCFVVLTSTRENAR